MVRRKEKESLEDFLQVNSYYDILNHWIENLKVQRGLGASLIPPSPEPEKEEKILFYSNILCHLSSSLPPERVHFHKHCLSTDHVPGSKLEKQKKTLHAIFWPKLINSYHLL